MKENKTRYITLLVTMLLLLVTVACARDTATPASCAYVVGDGTYDRDVHKIVYPGRDLPRDYDYEDVYYVPCNNRNYLINDGTTGLDVGDRNTPVRAWTSSGMEILVSASSYWRLNQNFEAMGNFYETCLKHSCASSSDLNSADTGDQTENNSTPGWMDLLHENFMPAMERAIRSAASQVDDSVWRTHDQTQYQMMADLMSAEFNDIVRKTLGYEQDLFCGSGNSNWPNPDNPGNGEFICTPVRFVIDHVEQAPIEAGNTAAGVENLNKERLKIAEALYGENAVYWLGLQDTVEKCKGAGITCIFNIGGTDLETPSMIP